ncbi:diphthine synthase [Cryptococcus gattii E566]|uniref:diphthine methyl ester synthase n=2 Tax=Cryptococcus gattii TaxID=37769 RepID=E6R7U6_CRYGW|nr:diphthine synthase, putative [Cryptococcus gattii WM276]ADV22847.1 diphthine synthase, putative [Cryptococcus gattii WM276]KIR82853.1 diphthine synthase [Cryptococcus gattii EJB2]KIY32258.1 diphthine synthase [Cryptococcus gattii E566]
MFYVIGLGLSDEKDITVKGLEAVKGSERVYLESYTSILMVEKEKLEAFYERPVITATRELVELEADDILKDADKVDISFLVVGDPLGATTHSDLLLRAQSRNIPTSIIHNASILTALGSTGLQMYSFGQTLSLPFYTETWRPDSWYPRLEENLRLGVHTLVLLDIKVREQSEENMARGRLIYEPPRFMNPAQAFNQMLLTESIRHPAPKAQSQKPSQPSSDSDSEEEGGEEKDPYPSLMPPSQTLAISLSRVGTPSQRLISGTLSELAALDEEEFGGPLHSVVIVGKRLHPLELEYAGKFAIGGENGDWWRVGKEVYGVERETFY